MELLPYTSLFLVAQTSPAGHPGTASHLSREYLPRDPALQQKEYARQCLSALDWLPARILMPSWLRRRKQRVRQCPKVVVHHRSRHVGLLHVKSVHMEHLPKTVNSDAFC